MSGPRTMTYASFSCHSAPNGGWVLEHDGRNHQIPTLLAAFSSSHDLVSFLAENAKDTGLTIGEEFLGAEKLPKGNAGDAS